MPRQDVPDLMADFHLEAERDLLVCGEMPTGKAYLTHLIDQLWVSKLRSANKVQSLNKVARSGRYLNRAGDLTAVGIVSLAEGDVSS